jgi:hypothetical protein
LRLSDFGLKNGINEIIAITKGKWINTAPIGIIVEDENSVMARAKLYASHTRENIKNGSKLWANVVFDPLIFVIATFEDLGEEYFSSLDPPILRGSAAWCKFEARLEGYIANLKLLDGEVLAIPLRAINRGFNALIEALVLATRYDKELKEKITYYQSLVEKCGGDEERRAFKLLLEYINESIF